VIFARECDMSGPVREWLRRQRLLIKEEFALPWGVCDFVAMSFNSNQVSKRLAFRQFRPIGPLHRVALLTQIPDHESGPPISLSDLEQLYRDAADLPMLDNELHSLISGRFVIQKENGLQRLNGWAPLHDRIVAVELKLSRVSEALAQAASHLAFATESYIALPAEIADRAATGPRSAEFRNSGIGILAVTRKACKIVLPASQGGVQPIDALQMHCVERFWRTKGSSS
jgi:hypothetical protein